MCKVHTCTQYIHVAHVMYVPGMYNFKQLSDTHVSVTHVSQSYLLSNSS